MSRHEAKAYRREVSRIIQSGTRAEKKWLLNNGFPELTTALTFRDRQILRAQLATSTKELAYV